MNTPLPHLHRWGQCPHKIPKDQMEHLYKQKWEFLPLPLGQWLFLFPKEQLRETGHSGILGPGSLMD